MAWWLVK